MLLKEKGILVSGFFFILMNRRYTERKGNNSVITDFFKDTTYYPQ
jgi:hypothetical protein